MTKKSKKLEKKRVEKKPVNKVAARKRPDPQPEPPKAKKLKVEDKYIKIALDAPQEVFKAIGERVQAGEVKWAYYGGDGSKSYHHYIVLQTNKK